MQYFDQADFVYQDRDKDGKPVELFCIQVGEVTIGWQLDIVPRVLAQFRDAYKKAVDARYIRRVREAETAISAVDDMLRGGK